LKRAADALEPHLRPERIRGAIEQDEVVVEKEPRDSEVQGAPVDLRVVDDAAPGQRTESHDDRLSPEDVVHDLVPPQDAMRVGAGLAVHDDPEDQVLRLEEAVALSRAYDGGVRQGGDPVFSGTPAHDLVPPV
jgi:hypothetical protein